MGAFRPNETIRTLQMKRIGVFAFLRYLF